MIEVEVLQAGEVALVAGPLLLGVGVLAAEPGEVPEAGLLDLLHRLLEGAVGEGLVALELDPLDLRLRPVLDDEGDLLPGGPDRLRVDLDVAEGAALLGQHLLDDRRHPPRLGDVVEGVHAQRGLALLELVLDVRGGELLAAAVVHDLDPLPLLHAEDHDLAVGRVLHVQDEVLEEARVPQAAEVVAQPPLVVAVTGLGGDVEEQRLLGDVLVVGHLDARDHGSLLRSLRLLGRGREPERERGQERGYGPQRHGERAPPRSSCQYHSAPSCTPISIGRCGRICPRMKASDSASSMWRWMARRSGRAP